MSKQAIRFSLRDMFPHIEEEQLQAIDKKLPIPPSKGWLEANGYVVPDPAASPEPPLVSCVLVFGEQKRMRLARRAVNNFVHQTYLRKQLVIVNTTGQPVTTVPYEPIKELMVETPLTIGGMRNHGIANADGTWIKQWDDDDIFEPNLLTYQMAHRREGMANLLTTQLRVNIKNASVYLHHQPEGIVNSMLMPRLTADYPNIDSGEDVAYYLANWANKTNVVNNDTFPATCLNTVVYHGHNILPVEQLMPNHCDEKMSGVWMIPPREAAYLKAALAEVGLVAQPLSAESS